MNKRPYRQEGGGLGGGILQFKEKRLRVSNCCNMCLESHMT